MSRAGDKDEGGQGGIDRSDSPMPPDRRTERPAGQVRKRPRAKTPPPDPSPGTGLITSLEGAEPYQPPEESADDVLDRVVSGHQPPFEQRAFSPTPGRGELDSAAAPEAGPPDGGYDDIREQLGHHQERRQPLRRGMPLRGSADLAPAS